MNHRERVLAAVERRPSDILPVGFKATDDVLRRLQAHFGAADVQALVRALPVDTFGIFNNCLYGVYPVYRGDPTRVLYPNVRPDGTWDTVYGYRRRWVASTGGYNDEVVDHPLEHAETLADLRSYDWPRADAFDYSTVARAVRGRGRVCHPLPGRRPRPGCEPPGLRADVGRHGAATGAGGILPRARSANSSRS